MKLFLLFLACAVWQDSRKREIKKVLLLVFGVLGVIYCFAQGREPLTVFMASLTGIMLLILSRLSDGGIGEGDGWFFIVAGLYLNPAESFLMFLSGLCFCGMSGLVLSMVFFVKGRQIKGVRLPFLPFLVPAGLWFLVS